MKIQQALYNQLSTFAGLTALVGSQGVFPHQLPEGRRAQTVTYLQVSQSHNRALANTVEPVQRWQVTAWGDTYEKARAVADQIVACLENFGPGLLGGAGGLSVQAIQQENQVDLYDPTVLLYQVNTDFMVWL